MEAREGALGIMGSDLGEGQPRHGPQSSPVPTVRQALRGKSTD